MLKASEGPERETHAGAPGDLGKNSLRGAAGTKARVNGLRQRRTGDSECSELSRIFVLKPAEKRGLAGCGFRSVLRRANNGVFLR